MYVRNATGPSAAAVDCTIAVAVVVAREVAVGPTASVRTPIPGIPSWCLAEPSWLLLTYLTQLIMLVVPESLATSHPMDFYYPGSLALAYRKKDRSVVPRPASEVSMTLTMAQPALLDLFESPS